MVFEIDNYKIYTDWIAQGYGISESVGYDDVIIEENCHEIHRRRTNPQTNGGGR